MPLLTDNLDLLLNTELTIQIVLDEYHDRIQTVEKRFDRKRTFEDSLNVNEAISEVFAQKYGDLLDDRHRDYTKTVADALGLTDYLPKE